MTNITIHFARLEPTNTRRNENHGKIILTAFVLPLVVLFGSADAPSQNAATNKNPDSLNEDGSGTLEKMIVASGSATMEIDLNRLNGTSPRTEKLESTSSRILSAWRFAVAPNSFFPVLVFNNVLRGPVQGSMGLIPQTRVAHPAPLAASLIQLVIEKLAPGEQFDLVVRDERSGFVFFNIAGHQYDYDADAQSLTIHGGRLLISKEFAKRARARFGRRLGSGKNLSPNDNATYPDHAAC